MSKVLLNLAIYAFAGQGVTALAASNPQSQLEKITSLQQRQLSIHDQRMDGLDSEDNTLSGRIDGVEEKTKKLDTAIGAEATARGKSIEALETKIEKLQDFNGCLMDPERTKIYVGGSHFGNAGTITEATLDKDKTYRIEGIVSIDQYNNRRSGYNWPNYNIRSLDGRGKKRHHYFYEFDNPNKNMNSSFSLVIKNAKKIWISADNGTGIGYGHGNMVVTELCKYN